MKNFKIGLQLFSVRDDMEKDMEGTLKKVAEMGYDCVEFAGYFGRSAEEVKEMLDKYGLEAVSVHQVYDIFLDKEKESIDYLKTLGVKYCAIPWMSKEKHAGNDAFSQTVKEITQVAKALKDSGIQMLYHNHDFEFEKFEGKYLLDWLYESVDSDLLQTEFDTCWVKYAGEDPCKYINKYADRCEIIHLKDFVCDGFNKGPVYALIDENGKEKKNDNVNKSTFEMRPLGQGINDIEDIIAAAEKVGAKYLIVEQDECPTASPLESAKMSIDYLKGLGL